MRNRATALAETLENDDYQAAGKHWQSLARLKVIGSDEVEQMIMEHAGMPLKNFVIRRIASYKEEALEHNFDEAERQLALLRTITRHFPQELLCYTTENLAVVLRHSREKKRIEEEAVRNNLAQSQQAAARKACEEADKEVKRRVKQAEKDLIDQNGCCTIS